MKKLKEQVLLVKDKASEIKKKAPEKTKAWLSVHKKGVIIVTFLIVTISLIYIFGWWEALGIFFIKFGLGIKVTGVKTFGKAVAKAGGKKVLATATAGMLVKRHFIDVVSKFFAEHSFKKFSNSVKLVLKLKIKEFKETSFWKKVQAFGVMLLSIPGVYLFWTKIITTAMQKIVYALMFPLFSMIWSFISGFFNVIGFILEILALNVLLDAISGYKWGKKILEGVDYLVYLLSNLFIYINIFIKYIFSILGIKFEPKQYIINKSIQFNNWLLKKLEKGFSKIAKVQSKRDRYINSYEKVSEKRYLNKLKNKDKKVSFIKEIKKNFKKRFAKKNWKEKRKERKIKTQERREKTLLYKRKQKIEKNKRRRRDKVKGALQLPYYDLVVGGEVPGRAK